ncbi:MAG TPA: hypothetical protein VMY88_03105 [Acidimicrobiales bacterium]|nr:hypothetical protein [Acidimicrobiales bacterium]
MAQHDLSRRAFLGATAGLVLASACGGGRQAVSTTTTAAPPLNLVLGSFQVLSGSEQRVAFGVLDGQKPVPKSTEVEVSFAPIDGPEGEFSPAPRHDDGIEARPLYVAHHTFDQPGMYTATARVGRRTAEAAVQVIDPATSKVPVPGQALPAVATPTTTDGRGVNPICTREPACPWHETSLDTALGEHRPIVLLVATPALCQSAVCGPVLDILLDVKADFESSVRFIHAEVFTDNTGGTTAPVVQALRLENEPFLFLAGADGIIKNRFDGPYDRAEAKAALAALARP